MGRFKVAIVEQGKEDLWRTYWIEDSVGTDDAVPSTLGRNEVVEAATVEEAIAIVQRQNPNCTVMLAGGEHHLP